MSKGREEMGRKYWRPATGPWLKTLERRIRRIELVKRWRNLVKRHSQLSGLPCVFCGQSLLNLPWAEITIDHLQPKSRGGTSLDQNLALCCLECNRAKGSLTVAEFIRTHPPPENAPVRFLYPELFAGELDEVTGCS